MQITILKVGHENLKASLMSNLEAKARFIRDLRQKELTEASVRRMNSEENHIKLCIALNDSAESIIEALENELQKQREKYALQEIKLNHFYQESLYYLDEYCILLIDQNDIDRDYEILKNGKAVK